MNSAHKFAILFYVVVYFICNFFVVRVGRKIPLTCYPECFHCFYFYFFFGQQLNFKRFLEAGFWRIAYNTFNFFQVLFCQFPGHFKTVSKSLYISLFLNRTGQLTHPYSWGTPAPHPLLRPDIFWITDISSIYLNP